MAFGDINFTGGSAGFVISVGLLLAALLLAFSIFLWRACKYSLEVQKKGDVCKADDVGSGPSAFGSEHLDQWQSLAIMMSAFSGITLFMILGYTIGKTAGAFA